MKIKSTLENILSKTKKILIGAALGAALTLTAEAQQPRINSINLTNPSTGNITNQGYFAKTNPSVPTEKRVYHNGKHFLSVLTANGIFALRPHPGLDVDGWGSTLYLQPFLAGATLGHTSTVQYNTVSNAGLPALQIIVNGQVSKGSTSTHGTWSSILNFIYTPSNKQMRATGTYQINLTSLTPADLNFWKLASNFLKNVPVNDGTTTNTGDMLKVIYKGDGMWQQEMQDLTWDPAVILNNGHFPWDLNNYLEVRVIGNDNVVDTPRQGYAAIAPASKPTLTVIMQSTNPNMKTSFGTYFDSSKGKEYWADNIAVTPWIRNTAEVTNYLFNITLESSAISNDCYSSEVNITSTDTTYPSYNAISATSSLTNNFKRVGSMKGNGQNFTGKVKVNNPQMCFRVEREL